MRRMPGGTIFSIIKTCQKDIGKPTEYVEENPALSNFFLSENELLVDAPHSLAGERSPANEQARDNSELNQHTNSNQTTTLQKCTELERIPIQGRRPSSTMKNTSMM